MVNSLIIAISIKLNATFGDGFRVYKDDVEQGLQEPCFFISTLKPSLKPLLGGRAFQTNPFDIHYFPQNAGDNGELFSIAEQLLDVLEMITLQDGDRIRGTDRSYEIMDGVLHFFVQFNMHRIKLVERTPMGTVDVTTGTTKGGLYGKDENRGDR